MVKMIKHINELHVSLIYDEQTQRFLAVSYHPSWKKTKTICGNQNRSSVISNIQTGNWRKKAFKWAKSENVNFTFSPEFEEHVVSIQRAGIQPGQSSLDTKASQADKGMKQSGHKVWKQFQLDFPELTKGFYFGKKISKEEIQALTGFEVFSGCEPDGGIIFNKCGIPVIAFEAKKQDTQGNAFDRINKNISTFQALNDQVAFVSILVGAGAGFRSDGKPQGMLGGALQIQRMRAHALGINTVPALNTFNGNIPSFFTSEAGFNQQQIETLIYQCLKSHFTTL